MNKITERLLASLLIPALDSMGGKWKTTIGVVLVATTFLAHIFGWTPIDTPLAWLGGETPYAWLMGIGETVFGLGLIHKAAKLPVTDGTTDRLP